MKNLCILGCLILLNSLPAFTLDQSIILGKEDLWQDIISFDNTRIIPGRGGLSDITLREGEYEEDEDTDILLHFNSPADLFTPSGYALEESTVVYSSEYKELGDAAAAFRNAEDSIVFTTGENTIFSPAYTGDDFSIEFRLYPARLAEGERILLWKGSLIWDGKVYPQELECSISARKILWRFENFFRSPDGRMLSLELQGNRSLFPRQWNHHLIRYDGETGLMEYLLNGVPEAITHTTDTGREEAVVYTPSPGSAVEKTLTLGGSFIGILDEMRISRSRITEPFIETYPQRTGSAMTGILDLEHSNSRLLRIHSTQHTPSDTAVEYYYKISDTLSGWNSLPGPWKKFSPGEDLGFETRGRYVQILMELYPEGRGIFAPAVSDLEVLYEPDLPPLPPGRVTALSGDRWIELSWRAVVDTDIAGYLVYYGFKPGNYFGTGLPAGESPLDAGTNTSLRLEGLENGKLYYFAVVAYDSSTPPHYSEFSTEISARPSAVHGNGQ
ncbi:MAG: fibronectin type III domain-containing protein [Spirochaetales bacterium]|nr:fibronectin type III domain-containing protein [Spirochaetales bacterium]